MAIFTAVAAAVSAAVGGGIFGAVAGFAARTLLTIGITKLVANKAGKTAAGTGDAGSRVQLPPASNNKLSVVYGTAYMAPIITDAKISEDQKTMWYVCSLAEVTDTGSYTFGDIYWAGKKVVFDGTDTAKVIRLETNSDPVQLDEAVNGKIYIYKFPNGSASGISTGGSNAITLLSDASIATDQRWNGPIYTTGGQSADMTDTAFVIVKVSFDRNAGTERLEQMSVELTNSLTKPGDVLNDYMNNSRYGCAISASNINSASITELNDYSDELIDYIPVGGGTATRPRYRINGPVNTGQNCLNNLQELVDACDSWLQYSELTGQWTIVVNRPYDWDGTTIGDLYQVTDDVLISGINVNPIDLNNAYNQLEVQFPDNQVNDQTNFKVINLIDFAPEVISPNEPENKLTVQFPQVNSYLQSTYLGLRRMLQSREDLVIDFTLDYSGIQVQAGDVITVPFVPYGWEAFNSGYGKLFRVSQVQEAKLDDGSLGARITAFEYNATVYADDPIQDFVESSNTGLTDPNIFDRPTTPIVLNGPIANGAINYFTVSSNVPTSGTTLYMDFNVGNSSNLQTHESYSSVQIGDGTPYSANSTVTINVADLDPGTYYWSATARNDIAGRQGNSSAGFTWIGPSVTDYKLNTFVCANSTGNVVTTVESTANVRAGMSVIVTGGTGAVAANTLVTNVLSSNTFSINPAPTTAFSCATLKVGGGGITAAQLNPSVGTKTSIGGTNFSITQTNPGTLPVSVTSTSTRNIPVYIDGTSISANNIFPWFQGTSSVSSGTSGNNFYGANSTGMFTPNDAQLLLIDDGDDNWYKVIFDSFPAGTMTNDDQYSFSGGLNVVANANCTIQVATGFSDNTIPYFQCETGAMQTVILTANEVRQLGFDRFYFGASASFDGSAVFVRNITSGARVYIYGGSLASTKSPFAYF